MLWGNIVLPFGHDLRSLSNCCMRVDSGQDWNPKCFRAGEIIPIFYLLFLNCEVRQGRHVWTGIKLSFHNAPCCPTGFHPISNVRQIQRERFQFTSFFLYLPQIRNICFVFPNQKSHFFSNSLCSELIIVLAMIRTPADFIFANEFDACIFLNSEQKKLSGDSRHIEKW